MGKRRKKKYRIKWKNIIILLIFLYVIFFASAKIIKTVNNLINKPKTEEKKEQPKPSPSSKPSPIPPSEMDQKLAELNNIQNTIDYFNNDFIDRYLAYKNNNPNLEIIQIIKDVNMNLDQEPYEFKIPARNTNTEKVLVNKYYYLEEDYVPNNLQAISIMYALSNMRMVNTAKDAFENMAKAAKEEKLNIVAMSTYRSYSYQVNLYNRYTRQDGKAKADTYSGRPGHSEHQTGLAVDVYNKKEDYTNFEKTPEFTWMQQHAHEYGFILRFPKDKENETGYEYEAWHYRYVGIDMATYIHENNISLEEYYATKIKDW